MKNDLSAMPRWKLGLIGQDSEGQSTIVATITALGKSARHALQRMKKETGGAHLCILGAAS